MNTKKINLLICSLLFILTANGKLIKIACIGNSITYGAFIKNRIINCYPSQLQVMLGDKYQVENFGVNGATALFKGDHPYISMKAFKRSKVFNPDIVFLMLGTNDSKPQNIKYIRNFKTDYLKLIRTYQALTSKPRIILIAPTHCFTLPDVKIQNRIIQKQLVPLIREIAYEEKLEIIDFYHLFGAVYNPKIMPDRLHPSAHGAGVMAHYLYDYLLTPRLTNYSRLNLPNAKFFSFYGFQGYNFSYNGIACKIVQPKVIAKGFPWIIRARFWGYEPQLDKALLERGFHIAYCDVANLYGSNEAVSRWNVFYKMLIKKGWNKKVALEGMSRGGLIIYNWAAQNLDKVACIYADAPVLDIKSWPLGKNGKRSEKDASLLTKAYGYKAESKLYKWNKNPLDHAKKIAKANIPLLHVVGDADETVPIASNTMIFKNELAYYDYELKVIHKQGKHHPHSLANPKPILDFVLKNAGQVLPK